MSYVCPRCGSTMIRRSRHRHMVDYLAAVVLLAPFRCQQCARRFFRFRLWRHKQVVALLIGLCFALLATR